ncbi:MAG: hypothetical protein IJS54_00010 [Desulfovibrio sp.]|nr:hypothetical protein [Desulfovibrio sp.]
MAAKYKKTKTSRKSNKQYKSINDYLELYPSLVNSINKLIENQSLVTWSSFITEAQKITDKKFIVKIFNDVISRLGGIEPVFHFIDEIKNNKDEKFLKENKISNFSQCQLDTISNKFKAIISMYAQSKLFV